MGSGSHPKLKAARDDKWMLFLSHSWTTGQVMTTDDHRCALIAAAG